MKKGFTLIEVLLGMLFFSVILLTFITVLLNINKTITYVETESIIYEKIKYLDKLIEDQINGKNGKNFSVKENQLYCDDVLIITYENKLLKIYNQELQIHEEEVDYYDINIINPKLIKIEIGIDNKKIDPIYLYKKIQLFDYVLILEYYNLFYFLKYYVYA